jgi:hypothetical protein
MRIGHRIPTQDHPVADADNAPCAVVVPPVETVECPLVNVNALTESVVDVSSVKYSITYDYNRYDSL